MANYKYIIVNKPDRGLVVNTDASNISDRNCSDCKNVYFRDGRIIKRFGYGAKKKIYNSYGVVSAGNPIQSTFINEITHIQMHESNVNVETATRRLYGFSLNNAMYYRPSAYNWRILDKGISQDNSLSAWSGWKKMELENTGLTKAKVGTMDIAISPITSQWTSIIKVEIDGAGAPNTFKWYKDGGGAVSATKPCSLTPILLSQAGTKYCYVSFSSTTGANIGDYTKFNFNEADDVRVSAIATASAPGGTIPVGSACLRVSATDNNGFVAYKKYSLPDWRDCTALNFWFYCNKTLSTTQLKFKIANDSAIPYNMPIKISATAPYTFTSGARYGGFKNLVLPSAYAANKWNNVTINFSALPSTYSQQNRLLLLEMYRGGSSTRLHLADLKLQRVPNTGLTSSSTKKSPTLAAAVLANINSSTQSYLVTTNYEQQHYVRYIDNGISDPKWSVLTGAADSTKGYNATTASDFHKCKAVSGYKEKLHLLGGSEDTAGTGAVDKLLQDRWSATNNAEEWQAGVATARNVADTSGAILNAVKLTDDNNYIFKTDAIVRQSFLGGESAIFSYNTVFQEDALLAAKMVRTVGDFCFWVGRKHGWAFAAGTSMMPITDEIEPILYSTDGIEYSNGQYHRRSFWMDLSIVNLVGLMVPVASAYPDKGFIYDPEEKVWSIWDFSAGTSKNITASDYAIGLVTTGNETSLLHSVHFGNSVGEFYEFDVTAKNDGAAAIDAYWISKAFSNPETERAEITAWNGLDFEGYGDGVTVSIMGDDGVWQAIATKTLTATNAWYTVGFYQQARFLKVKFSNNTLNESFHIGSFTLRYEDGATH